MLENIISVLLQNLSQFSCTEPIQDYSNTNTRTNDVTPTNLHINDVAAVPNRDVKALLTSSVPDVSSESDVESGDEKEQESEAEEEDEGVSLPECKKTR
jgi:hypothetical protein